MKLQLIFFNLFSKFFLKIRYYNKKDPFLTFKKIIRNKKIEIDSNKKTILIAPVRVSPISNLFEGLLAYFYKSKGYKVKAIMCDQALPICENISKNDKFKNISCALCKKEQDRFCKIFNIEKISLKHELQKDDLLQIENEIEIRVFKNEKDFEFNGVNLKEDIISGVMRYTLKSDFTNDLNLIRKFAESAFICSTAMKRIQDREKAKLLILSHGIYSTWGSLLTTAKAINLHSIVWGRGYIGQGDLLFGHNRNYHEDFILEDNRRWENIELTEEQINETKNYFFKKANNVNVDYVNYYDNLKKVDFNVDGFWKKIKKYKRKIGMFTNIPWDGQVFNKTIDFPTTKSYVAAVIEWVKLNSDFCLIIRTHPAEKSGLRTKMETFSDLLLELYPKLPNNVYLLQPDNPISSYDLVKEVDVSILYGSTLSLEFAVLGYPVIQTGRFNVSNKGIVFEAADKKLLYEYLNKVRNNNLKMTNNMKMRTIKYGYYWIFNRHIKDETVILKKLNFIGFKFNNFSEFINNKTLNFIFEKIESNEPIIK